MNDEMSNNDAGAIFVNITELDEYNCGESLTRGESRLKHLHEFYCDEFGSNPQFYVRVPGRVNIIGEHVDYCGYPVLPMALDQCIILAVGFSEENTFLQLRNADSGKFENFKCDLKTIKIDLPQTGGPEWYKYYLCGVKGIQETLGNSLGTPLGMTVALSGNIPPAAGLSSSSALVSAAVLATAHVQQVALNRKKLASIAASCERYIGTQGGGMDQAIAYLAKAGCAQFIEFYPELNATAVQLPKGACFVVANSLAESNKAATSDFNERVVECRLATRIIARQMQLSNWQTTTRLIQLQESLKCTLSRLEELAMKYLPNSIYTRSELCEQFLEVSEEEFVNEFLTANTQHMVKFKLRLRALHVIQESLRVCEFRSICEKTANSHLSNSNGNARTLQNLSQLMRQSHHSLKDLYECSHPDLDRLIEISDDVGVGARLTGAGWGGCIVALCNSVEESENYIRVLKEKYFSTLPAHISEKHLHNDFAEVVFATRPCSGAEIFIPPPTLV